MVHPDNSGIFFSAPKRNELSAPERTWKKISCKLLSERNHSEGLHTICSPTICDSGKGKTTETIKRSLVVRG